VCGMAEEFSEYNMSMASFPVDVLCNNCEECRRDVDGKVEET
jgi:hypothetical protein